MSYMQMPYFAVFLLTICRIKLSNYKQSQTRLFSIESNLTFLEMGEDSSASSVETMPCGIVAQNQEMYQWFLMNHFDLNALWFWNGHRILSWGASQLQTHGKGSGRHFSGGFFIIIIFPVVWQQTVLLQFQTYPHQHRMKVIWDILWSCKICFKRRRFYRRSKWLL